MQINLERDGLSAVISTVGAELQSLRVDGREYLWQGDPRWWDRRAPILFPMVGSLRRDTAFTLSGGTCRMTRHGFARDTTHAVLEQQSDTVTFRLEDSAWSRKQYPYAFRLDTTYSIAGPRILTIRFAVTNTGDGAMPFVIGGHPGFQVPLPGTGEDFTDYALQFEQAETLRVPSLVDATGELDFTNRRRLAEDSDTLPLDHHLFDHDALVFDNLQTRTLTLRGSKSGHGVRIDFADFPMIGVWSPAGEAPFVALEPWTGCTACVGEDDCFDHKRGMRTLPPGETAVYTFSITVF